ncbi:MAG: sigma-54-dependent Fis family transcriptional regulator [Bdellovibrionales bacterium]|nr:sigma-54-dependent Fis family transcriptional regulator [Bdellovibrionales bacterium]
MKRPKLVVIDDDPDVQDLLVGFFRPKGYELITFDDAEEALKAISSADEFCDVIISDLRLPNMSGVELTVALLEKGITTPLIIMTAHRSAEVALEAIEAGAYDFVVKPLHFPQLQVSVERALHFSRMREENQALRAVVAGGEQSTLQGIIGKSPKFLRALDLARRVANSSAHVLISGESGSGKEVVAKAIHQFGNRKKGPFVAINCSAIPENLLEAELFGYAKGAFTGAVEKRVGLFEEAAGGTLFLDEIGDLSLPLQAKLLRVLQDKKIKRLGENQTRTVDVRVVSATHKNLRQEVMENRFREDLFFRLNVIPIGLPPLRERKEDIMPLSEFFLKKHAALNRIGVKGFTKGATEYLLKNPWKGNVRELENVIERAVVLSKGTSIDLPDLNFEEEFTDERKTSVEFIHGDQPRFVISEEKILPLDELINKYIVFALGLNQGAKDRTAKDLGVDRKTLYRRVREMEQSALSGGGLPQ